MMWGALIGAAGSLIGGVMKSNSAKKAANQERSWALGDQAEQFVRLRAAAEKGGFNPLSVLGAAPNSGMVNPTNAAQSYMGDAIATSSLMLADSMSKTAAAANGKKLQNANRANADLSRKLTAATLRPNIAGVFDRASKFGIGGNISPTNGGIKSHPLNASAAQIAQEAMAAIGSKPTAGYGGSDNQGVNRAAAFVEYVTPDGKTVRMANPQSSDADQDIWMRANDWYQNSMPEFLNRIAPSKLTLANGMFNPFMDKLPMLTGKARDAEIRRRKIAALRSDANNASLIGYAKMNEWYGAGARNQGF